MNKNINKITIIFFILMLVIPIFSFNVGATESIIDTDFRDLALRNRNIVVRSDGVMFSAMYNQNNPTIAEVYISTDSGVSWNLNLSQACSYSVGYSAVAIGVDDDNAVHFFYVHVDVQNDIMHRQLNITSGVPWSDPVIIYNSVYAGTEYKGMDLLFDDDNMYFLYTWYHTASGQGSYVRFTSYNFVLETWGATVTLSRELGSDVYHSDVSLVSYNNDIIATWSNNSGNDFIEGAYYTTSTDTWSSPFTVVSDSTYFYSDNFAINYDNEVYVFYSGNDSVDESFKRILYKVYDGSWSNENTLHGDIGYSQYDPCASVTSGGDLNVVWTGKSSVSSSYFQLRQKVYYGGSWGSTAFISSGASNKRYPCLLYQEYPYFTHLIDGVVLTYKDDSNNDLEYIDSGSLIWYTGGAEGEYSGDFEFDANNNIGNLDTGCTMGFGYKTIEFKYQVPTTINATGFDLLVSDQMHGYNSDLTNYDLYINGEPMGNPTEWKEYSNKWVLRWTFSSEKIITNSEILFEVYNDFKILGNYWYVGVSCGYNDLDGDGIASLRYSDTYPNGAYDGTWLAKDVAYQIYFNVISFVEDETDVLYNTISAVNTTYYVGESTPLTYTIKACDLVYDNYVRIWNDDTSTEITAGTMQGFPYLCTHQVETIGFVPFTSANYTAHLYINSVEVDNVSFYPQDHINSEMYVFTYPNPSMVGQKVWVSYKFDHPTGKDGAIFLSLTPNLNNYISVNYLSDGDTGFWTTSHDTVGTYYYIMAVDINGNGTYGIVNNGVHAHYVRSEHGNNYFTLGGYNLRLNIEGTITQIVSGESNMVSGNCYIYDNNQLVKTITGSPFSYNYEIHTAGHHTVEMRLITNVTTVLCTQNYTVSTYTGEDDIEQVEDSGDFIRDYIYNNYGDFGIFIAGICIILGFMFIPFGLVLAVNVKFNKNVALGDLHWSIYLIFAIVGVIVVVQLHLADLWIILLICVVSIAITVISYNGRNS